MKTLIIIILTGLIGFSYVKASSTETNGQHSNIENALTSDSPKEVVSIVPEINKLWPQDPEAYLNAVNRAAHILGGALNDVDNRRAFLSLFSSAMAKAIPADETQAPTWVGLKSDLILYYLNFDEVRNNKAHLIEIAKFVGEVRSLIIPQYSNRGTAQPGVQVLIKAGVLDPKLLKDPELKQEYEKAVQENQRDMLMNQLQSSLFQADRTLIFQLLHDAAQFPSSESTNVDFIQKITAAAKLTGEESRQL